MLQDRRVRDCPDAAGPAGSAPSWWEVHHSPSRTEPAVRDRLPWEFSILLNPAGAGGLGLASYGTDVLGPELLQWCRSGLGERPPSSIQVVPGWNQPSPISPLPLHSKTPWQRGCLMPLMTPMGPKSTDPQLSKPQINPALTKH